jgi:hypothetical protein
MMSHSGKGRGFDLNLLSACQQYTDDIAANIVNIFVVHWTMSHSRSPEHEGVCRYNNLKCGKRKIEFDDMSWGEAKKVAQIAAG